jgi:elongator complex protein 3
MTSDLIHALLVELLSDPSFTTKRDYQKAKNALLVAYKWEVEDVTSIEVIEYYRQAIEAKTLLYDPRVWKILRKRGVRSLSGVSVISLLTKFWGCPGKCVFCPTYEGLPKSYITGEPAVQRAEANLFDPVKQIQNRLRSLEITGNAITKCDIRVIGGTWSVYPIEYQEDFMRGVYDAHTTYSEIRPWIEKWESLLLRHVEQTEEPMPLDPSFHLESSLNLPKEWWKLNSEKSQKISENFARFKVKKWYEMHASATLEEAKKRNETAESRVIGIAIETRPDWVNVEEIIRLRRYWVTRVEIWYQTTIDRINDLNKRWHGNHESIEATRLLKDAGMKVVAHMMPDLLGSTPDDDRASMDRVFSDPDFRPDEMKIYPMVVTPHSELEGIWREWGFTPYDDETLIDLMADLQGMLPEYIRLNRMYRDIPADQILAGSKLANLRQLTEAKMKAKWITRHDISAREIRARGNNPEDAIFDIYTYEASWGKEYFIQYIDPVDRTLFWLLRLRIPSQYFTGETHFIGALKWSAIVRELHVFGDQLGLGMPWDGTGQHMGFGKKMMQKAEDIILGEYRDIEKIAVIAWVGVRWYYTKIWYILEDEYMVKTL